MIDVVQEWSKCASAIFYLYLPFGLAFLPVFLLGTSISL